MKKIFLLSLIFLQGCQPSQRLQEVSNFSSTELTKLPDREFCENVKELQSSHIRNSFESNFLNKFEKEKRRRNKRINDCSDDHFSCVERGLKTNSSKYLNCRNQIKKERYEKQKSYNECIQRNKDRKSREKAECERTASINRLSNKGSYFGRSGCYSIYPSLGEDANCDVFK